MTQGFESVEHELEQKRLTLEQELTAVRGRAAEIEADLERVHEAIGALTGSKKKSKSSSRSRSRKPATTVEMLQQFIGRVREENPFADAAALERGVRAMVREHGSSLAGFKGIFAEALLTSPGKHEHAHTSQSHGQPFFHEVDDPFAN
jgi:chromosome segregation ATPase